MDFRVKSTGIALDDTNGTDTPVTDEEEEEGELVDEDEEEPNELWTES